MSLPSRHRRLPVAALAALATVGVYGLAGVSGLLHLALTPHRVCLDHGELVDAGHAERVAGAEPTVPALAASLAAEGHGHDHCAVADHLRQQGLAPEGAAIGPAAPPAERAPAAPAVRAHRPIPTLLLAPKHSPPAAA